MFIYKHLIWVQLRESCAVYIHLRMLHVHLYACSFIFIYNLYIFIYEHIFIYNLYIFIYEHIIHVQLRESFAIYIRLRMLYIHFQHVHSFQTIMYSPSFIED